MNHMFHPFLRGACCAVIATITLAKAHADTRQFSIPSYQVNAGSILEVPVSLDNAAGLAAIQMQINFDPAVLELVAVKSDSLGNHFELSRGDGEGFVQLTFIRAEAMTSGSGRLAVLRFRANPGAETTLQSELALADLTLSDGTGVIDLQQKDVLSTTPAKVILSADPDLDNAGSGLPDWWEEQYGLSLFTSNAALDPDQDGSSNLLEYAFGGNPLVSDGHARGIRGGRTEVNGATFLSLGFYRRQGDPSLLYRVEESTALGGWNDLSISLQMIGTPQDMGDGTEYVTVRGTIPVTGPSAQRRGFMRVEVQKP